MKKLLLLLLTLLACACGASQCTPDPTSPSPAVVGGSTSTGGASATGGAPTGGQSATGGTTVTTTAAIAFIDCNPASAAPKERVQRNLSGWRRSPERAKRRRSTASYDVVAPSSFPRANFEVNLDQGRLGSCTGNAVAHCLSTWPFPAKLTEDDAVKIYSLATTLDPFQGVYPPVDSGSDGESAAKAAKKLGYTKLDFSPVYTLESLQRALLKSTCIVGTDWYEGFSDPTLCGELKISGKIEGGHQIQIAFWDAELKRFGIRNSWKLWGNKRTGTNDTGYAYWSAGTLQRLLNDGAEIDCPNL